MGQKGKSVLEINEAVVEEFLGSLQMLSPARTAKYRWTMKKISRELGIPFERISREELRGFIEKVNLGKVEGLVEDWTKRDYRMIAKKFFGWLRDPEFVKWIKIGEVKSTVGPDDVFTDDELSVLRSTCENIRDKALIETLYETACRPHEFLGLRKSDVSFDEYGAIVYVRKGKTGARRVRVVNASPLLANWIKNHPLKDEESPIWIDLSTNTRYQPLLWIGLKRHVKRLARSASIQKRVNPYLFRHTRLTHLARFMTEAQLCEFAGWSQGSNMPSMYVHLSGRDVDAALLKAYGLKTDEETQISKTPPKCPRCSRTSEVEAQTCSGCGMALTAEAAMKVQQDLSSREAKIGEMESTIEDLLGRLGAIEIAQKEAAKDGSVVVVED